MKKYINKKTMLFIIILTIILLPLLLYQFTNSNLAKQIVSKISKQEEKETIIDNIEYMIVDNTNVPMALVTISRQLGIESIQYGISEDNLFLLNCNGKKKVSIDLKIAIGEIYTFKIISNGIEDTKKISFSENYLDDYIKISNDKGNINISYNNHKDNITNYYKLGNNGNWVTADKSTDLSLSQWNYKQFSNVTTNNGTAVLIYGKQADSFGNEIIVRKTFPLKEVSEQYEAVNDVFTSLEESGKTLNEYGFTASYSNCEYSSFQSRSMGGGHTYQHASWSATFALTFNDVNNLNKTPDLISTNAILQTQWSDGSSYYQQSGYYTDGAQISVVSHGINGYSGNGSTKTAYPELENTNSSLKEINYLQFNLYGFDPHGGFSAAYLSRIILVYNQK